MNEFGDDIEKCLEVLRKGGNILYPTDTIWGIGCDATDANAVEKVIRIKSRPLNKSFVVLVADEQDVLKYTAAPDLEVFNYLAKVSKPTTVIYPNAIGLADQVVAPDGSVAIRIVQDAFCRHLIRRLRKPLLSTSANVSGDPSPAIFNEIAARIRAIVDYVVSYRQNDTSTAIPSSIIQWKTDGQFTVIRP